jgi:hypothetical protein
MSFRALKSTLLTKCLTFLDIFVCSPVDVLLGPVEEDGDVLTALLVIDSKQGAPLSQQAGIWLMPNLPKLSKSFVVKFPQKLLLKIWPLLLGCLLAPLGKFLGCVRRLREVTEQQGGLSHGIPLPILHHQVVPKKIIRYSVY